MPITKTDYKILREKIIDWNKKNPDGFMRWDVLANFIYSKNKKPKDEENIKRQIRVGKPSVIAINAIGMVVLS